MMNEINCGSYFHERIVLKKNDGEMLAYVPERTCLECHDDCINKGDTWGECWHCARNHDDNYIPIGQVE